MSSKGLTISLNPMRLRAKTAFVTIMCVRKRNMAPRIMILSLIRTFCQMNLMNSTRTI